jgi:hypothetical protein
MAAPQMISRITNNDIKDVKVKSSLKPVTVNRPQSVKTTLPKTSPVAIFSKP